MAEQPRVDSDSAGGVDDDGGHALVFSVLHDLLGAAVFLAFHPLHTAYALFFSRYILSLASFFWPLLVSTSLLLAVLVTAAPYVTPGWPGLRSLGSTCAIAVAALCAELRPDAGRVGLVAQLCSFVLGPADVAAVLRVGEIMGELCDCDIGDDSCFLLEEKSFLSATEEHTLQRPFGEEIFLNQEGFYQEIFKDEIEEKNVVLEDLKGPDWSPTSSEHSCPSETFEISIKVQSPSLSVTTDGGVSDGVEDKRVDCDPVPVESKKCERVKSHSSISRRIRQWEDATSGNPLDNNSLEKGSFKGMKVIAPLETESFYKNGGENHLAQDIAFVGESDREQPDQEFIDVKELLQPKTGKCSKELQAQENGYIEQTKEELQEQNVQAEPELQEQNHKDEKQPEQDCQDVESPTQELREQEHGDADEESETLCNDAREENPLKSTSIAGRVQTRISSENIVGERSPHKEKEKDKEWKRTLACKLYEERIQVKLCRDRAVVGAGSDDMDMLWEAYETGEGSSAAAVDTKRAGSKAKRGTTQEESVDGGESEEEDVDDEGPVRQLCCLQALKFSTRKMNFGGGKPSLAKISRVLKRMTALSRVGSRRK